MYRIGLLATLGCVIIFVSDVRGQDRAPAERRVYFMKDLSTSPEEDAPAKAHGRAAHKVQLAKNMPREVERVFPDGGRFEERHRAFGLHRWYQVKAKSRKAARQLASELRERETVSEAVVGGADGNLGARSGRNPSPSDPRRSEQWNLDLMEADSAWAACAGNAQAVVMVQDLTGFDLTHEDIAATAWTNPNEVPGNGLDDDDNGYVDDVHGPDVGAEYNNYSSSHGTSVAGVLGAERENGAGIAGLGGSCVEVMYAHGQNPAAIVYAADHGATATSHSFVVQDAGGPFADAARYFRAVADGVVVFAAGNDPASPNPIATSEAVWAATAATEDTTGWTGSSRGSWAEFAVPTGVLGPRAGGGYRLQGGTSAAAPHLAGAVALLQSASPDDLSAGQVRWLLEETAIPLQGADADQYGAGIPHVGRASQRLQEEQYPNVTFSQASSTQQESEALVTWQTQSERSVGSFVVETRSARQSGHTWRRVSQQPATGSGAYQATADSLLAGRHIFRVVAQSASRRIMRSDTFSVRLPPLPPPVDIQLEDPREVTLPEEHVTAHAALGSALTPFSDLNGDGVPEVVAGAPLQDNGGVYLFRSDGASSYDANPLPLPGDVESQSSFGSALASVGDLDGNGTPDLAVGASTDSEAGTYAGAVYLYFMDGESVASIQKVTADLLGYSAESFDMFGSALCAMPGGRLFVGAPGLDGSNVDQGGVYEAILGEDGQIESAELWGEGLSLHDYDGLGSSLTCEGGAFLAGAPDVRVEGDEVGGFWRVPLDGGAEEALFVSRGHGGLTAPLRNQDDFGASLTMLGDLDGNGAREVLASAPGAGANRDGLLYVLFMGQDGGGVTAYKKLSGAAVSAPTWGRFGSSMAVLPSGNTLMVGAKGVSSGAQSSGSIYEVSLQQSSLPVEMSRFEAVAEGARRVHFRWRTESETNNRGFRLEHRRAAQGEKASSWQQLAFVEGQGGATTTAHTYQYQAEDLFPGTHRFRLRQIDRDGTSTVVARRTVTLAAQQAAISAPWPNPLRRGAARIRVATTRAGTVRARLYDAMGRLHRTLEPRRAEEKENVVLRVESEGLSAGTYFLQVQTPTETTTRTLNVVQ